MNTKEQQREYKRKWNKENPDKVRKARRKSMQKWREMNPVKAKARCKKWRAENSDKAKKSGKAWREANSEKVKNRVREWKKNNPDKVRAQCCKRRARKLNAEGAFTAEDIKDLYATQGGRCYYCRVSIEDGYHIDHMTPIIRGGSNDISNLCLTDPDCNLRKHTKTAEEFISER